MKFLSTVNEIEATLKRLIRNCEQLRWAVAWASHGTSLFHLLKDNEDKIQQLTAGIHFYQTHPDFIRAFLEPDRTLPCFIDMRLGVIVKSQSA